MSKLEELLKLSAKAGDISAYAINGNNVEINTGTSLIHTTQQGAIDVLCELSPALFAVPREEREASKHVSKIAGKSEKTPTKVTHSAKPKRVSE